MAQEEKTCPYCKETFVSNHPNRKYCSESHRVMAYQQRKKNEVMITPNEEGQAISLKEYAITFSVIFTSFGIAGLIIALLYLYSK